MDCSFAIIEFIISIQIKVNKYHICFVESGFHHLKMIYYSFTHLPTNFMISRCLLFLNSWVIFFKCTTFSFHWSDDRHQFILNLWLFVIEQQWTLLNKCLWSRVKHPLGTCQEWYSWILRWFNFHLPEELTCWFLYH